MTVNSDPGWQFDVKLDHQFSGNQRLSGRYSRHHDMFTRLRSSGTATKAMVLLARPILRTATLEYNWAIRPTLLWTNRFSVDRVNAPGIANNYPSLSDVGLPPNLRPMAWTAFLP